MTRNEWMAFILVATDESISRDIVAIMATEIVIDMIISNPS